MNFITGLFREEALILEISRSSRSKSLKKGETLINPGDEIVYMPLITKGSIRIIRENQDGSEAFLYHLHPGQTCALSLTCCQAGKKSMVKGIAEIDSEVLLIEVAHTEDWFQFKEWRRFISQVYSERMSELIQVVDLIAFNNMDKQLIHYLEERARVIGSKFLDFTHQEIADELSTSREVISRLLRVLEEKNQVKLGRNNIEILWVW